MRGGTLSQTLLQGLNCMRLLSGHVFLHSAKSFDSKFQVPSSKFLGVIRQRTWLTGGTRLPQTCPQPEAVLSCYAEGRADTGSHNRQ
jgi:hypothetical protein